MECFVDNCPLNRFPTGVFALHSSPNADGKANRPAACLAVHADKWLTKSICSFYTELRRQPANKLRPPSTRVAYNFARRSASPIQCFTLCPETSRCDKVCLYVQSGPKNAATDSWQQLSQILTDLGNFFTERFLSKFEVKRILNIPPHLPYVATLPCETLMSAKQAINDKLQGTVATYLRCDGVVNNQIKKGLLLSVWVKMF